eukprot:TRINITY_DN18353_c0_g1_i1.p1 TRINITY_DN18353_c0_g1~~TRINITY_DN18353_c0_g1_i1.p1  ORF type:complete len:135 (-),score=39.26 TRINITY_DN18353_c0_g1_i1:71-475(-)
MLDILGVFVYLFRYFVRSWYFFFFFKQKTAYEMLRSLVGSEMCIRDRVSTQSTGKQQSDGDLDRLNLSCPDHSWSMTPIEDQTHPIAPRRRLPNIRYKMSARLEEAKEVLEKEYLHRLKPVSYTHLTLPTKRIV